MVAAPPTAEEVELLVDGARYGDLEDVVAALEDGVAVDAVDEHGRTGKGIMHIFPKQGRRLFTSLLLPRALTPSRTCRFAHHRNGSLHLSSVVMMPQPQKMRNHSGWGFGHACLLRSRPSLGGTRASVHSGLEGSPSRINHWKTSADLVIWTVTKALIASCDRLGSIGVGACALQHCTWPAAMGIWRWYRLC